MITALVALAWMNAPPSQGTTDPDGVMRQIQERLAKANTAVGAVVFPAPTDGSAPMRMEFRFAKPNRFVTVLGTRESWCDGKSQYVLDTKTRVYDQFPVTAANMPRYAWGFDSFFPIPAGTYTLGKPAAGTFAGKAAVLADFNSPALRTTVKVAFDPESQLPAGFVLGSADQARQYRYEGVKLDVPLADTQFSWQPREGWQKREPPVGRLLAVGTKAPDFTLTTPSGERVTLSDALKGKKGLLLNFWFVACGPCQKEFPHLQAMYPALKAQGFEYLSVNQGDPASSVTTFLKEKAYTFPVALNGAGDSDVVKSYGVPAFPTNLVIAPDGTVVARFVGFDEEGMKAAIRKLGVTVP